MSNDPDSPRALGLLREGGGPVQAQRGLAAFWREVEEEAAGTSPFVGKDATFAALDGWLEDEIRTHALLLGEPGVGKSALLARWAIEIAQKKPLNVLLVPILRRLQTALERNALWLFFGLLYRADPRPMSVFSPPPNLDQLRCFLRKELAIDRTPDEPARVIILDGIDEALDFRVDSGIPFLGELGPGVRLLVSARMSAPEAFIGAAKEWRSRLGWEEEETASILVPSLPPELIAATARFKPLPSIAAGELLDALRLLAGALGPLRIEDFTVLLGKPSAGLLERALTEFPGVIERDDETRAYRFRHDLLGERLWQATPAEARAAIERRLREAGKETLAALRDGRLEPAKASPHLIEYRDAYISQAQADLDDWMELVTPEWLRAWAPREDAYLGLVTDVGRARARAEAALAKGRETASRARAVVAMVRCALVEAALFSLEQASRPKLDPEALLWWRPVIDLGHPIRVGEQQGYALVALARELPSPARDEVLSWADEAARRNPGPMEDGRVLLEIARSASGPRREQIAREAAEGFRRAEERRHNGWALSLLYVAALLPEAEGRALVREAVERSQAFDPQKAAPWMLANLAGELPAPLVDELRCSAPALSPGNRRRLLARLVRYLPEPQRALAIEEVSGLILAHLEAGGLEQGDDRGHLWPDAHGDLDAVAPYLPEPLVRRALEATRHVLADRRHEALRPLAGRLAALGQVSEAIALIHGMVARDDVRAEGLLRVFAHASPIEQDALRAELRALLGEMDHNLRGQLIVTHAVELIAALGAEEAIRAASATEDYLLIEAPAALVPALPKELRAKVTGAAVAAFRELFDGNFVTLQAVVACSPDMSIDDASLVLCQHLGRWPRDTYALPTLLRNDEWVDLAALAPLITRVGGDAAVLGAAEQIVEVGAWFR